MSEQELQAIKQRTDNYAYGIRDIHITERYASRAIEDVWKLVAEVERLGKALEFYAANENYERVANEPDICEAGYSHPTWEPSWIEFDKGETARKALAGD